LTGALSGAVSVMLGAMAAHSLKGRLSADELSMFETGVRYQQYHTIAIFLCGFLTYFFKSRYRAPSAFFAFVLGIICFCGSLYFLAAKVHLHIDSEIPQAFYLVTPLGGAFFIIGWMLLAATALNRD
jgi:uncharacterized membrane protein YgdD (TMEM256/DUF423 family)